MDKREIRLILYRTMSDGSSHSRTKLAKACKVKVSEIQWELDQMEQFTVVKRDKRGHYSLR